jgi:hypothetical protein
MKLVRLIKVCLNKTYGKVYIGENLSECSKTRRCYAGQRHYCKNTEAQLQASREVGLEVNTEETKCRILSFHRNVGQNHNLLIANKFFKNVSKFGIIVINQNSIMKKLRADEIQGMLATIQFRIFCISISSVRT